MQLTVDAETPIDIEYKMSTIKEVTLNKIITNNVVDILSDDIKNSDGIVKDVTCKLASSNDDLQNVQLNGKIEQDDATTSIESEEVENNTSEDTSGDDCDSKSHSPTSKKNEINKIGDNVSNAITINQHQESDSRKNLNTNHDLEDNNLDNDVNKQRSNSIISKSEMKNQIKADDSDDTKNKDLEDTTNNSDTSNKKIIVKTTDIEKNDVKETNNDTKNLNSESSISIDDVFIESDNKKEKSCEEVCRKSQSENTVSPILPKIKDDHNEAEKAECKVDPTCENTPNNDISMNESELRKEGVATETFTKNGTFEIVEEKTDETEKNTVKENSEKVDSKLDEEKNSSLISKLSNILDILSDDEEELRKGISNIKKSNVDQQCISLVDDDDVMLIDEDTSVKDDTNSISVNTDKVISESCDETTPNQGKEDPDELKALDAKNEAGSEEVENTLEKTELDGKTNDEKENFNTKPLLPLSFLNTCKKSLTAMTREDLEDFCSLKIMESVMERCNLGDLKNQLKTMALTIEEFKKKTTLLTKQNRDLQVVLKSIQEEQKKPSVTPLIPLKITRSVGMQVLMTDKPNAKRKNAQIINSSVTSNQPLPVDKSNRNTGVQKVQKTKNQTIPVPRLVPAANNGNKTSTTTTSNTTEAGKLPQIPPVVNGVRNSPPIQKPEKRSRLQSVTVDLTDDEPPMKVTAKSSPAPAVRLVPAQNLLPPQRPQFSPTISSPRKVYIPISGPQSQNIRSGQAVVLKPVPPSPGPRPRMPANNNVNKMQSNTIRMNRPLPTSRHPAPLPDAVKQYQPTSWKALPPAPDLKLSKVENGIVISWKIDGYQEDSYEEITSYQLFAYQETNSPPSTALWKKIGDVKALPLPMACTLTQFLAGYKYYFAVRAVDIKSRFGPFSLPASILLLNKM